jgi:ribosome recycling factor
MADDDAALIQDEAREGMEKAIRSLKAELQKIRTGRANVALLDGVQVDYYGTPTPLNQLANLTTPDPRLIVVSPYDKGSIGDIEKAIMKADLGLSPSNDGKVVRVAANRFRCSRTSSPKARCRRTTSIEKRKRFKR